MAGKCIIAGCQYMAYVGKRISMIRAQMFAAMLCGARGSKYGYKLNDSG